MPDRDWHISKAERFESFLKQINTAGQAHKEWIVTTWFYICVHYADAFLATKGRLFIPDHSDRRRWLGWYPETRSLEDSAYRLLEKASKEARYEGEPHYTKVRSVLRGILGLP